MNDLRPEYHAAELLSRQRELGYGLWVKDLDFGRRIVFDTFENYRRICPSAALPTIEGCTVRSEELDLILYNHGWDVARINYTLAHEVGHILLGHEDADTEGEEREANRFASALIVPFAPLRALGRADARRVADFFGCSLSAADAALRRPNVVSPYDEGVLALYKDRLQRRGGKRNPLDILRDI